MVIATALACAPKLLIADEPTTALDVTIQSQILSLLEEIKAEFGMGMILISHDMGVIASCADRVAVMYAGQVIESAPKARSVQTRCGIRTHRRCWSRFPTCTATMLKSSTASRASRRVWWIRPTTAGSRPGAVTPRTDAARRPLR